MLKQAAEEHQCDPDDRRWEGRMKKVAKQNVDKPE
jgi:hypothetical protein